MATMGIKKTFLLLASLIPTLAIAAEATDEDWYHRTDVKVMRSIDSNNWEGELRYLGGPDFHKLLIETEPEVEDSQIEELDIDVFYARPFGRYGLWKTGVNYRYRPDIDTRIGAGIEYLFPYFVDVDATLYQASDHTEFDIELEREFDLTEKWSISLAAESRWSSKTLESQELGNHWNYIERRASIHYRYNVKLHFFMEYKAEQLWGKLKENTREEGLHTQQEGIYLGISVIF